jgi:aminopeptidase N
VSPGARRIALLAALALAAAALAVAGWRAGRALWLEAQILDSGGPLRPLQAAYDVRRIDLAFRIEPETRRVAGRGTTTAEALLPLETFELQLDDRLKIARVAVEGRPAAFAHDGGLVSVALAPGWRAGERHAVEIVYSGRPKVAADPPWIDGFVWAKSASGAPWVAVTVQGDGADLWWPAKDHPSDEPDEGYSVELTVPRGLAGLSNGRKVAERANPDGSVTSRWESRHPVNNYLITVSAGEYVAVEERYRGADGTLDLPMTFYALPEHLPAARRLWREAPAILAAFARRFGEFPFLDDKIAMVDAPFAGMEHQTLVAYGDDFLADDSGIDETLVHELAHEWWGNKVSVRDWDDFWIQEGFATYAEVLWIEARFGPARARDHLERLRAAIENVAPLVAGRPRTAAAAYANDLYNKGAWVLASLRFAVGDETFFRVLRRFAGAAPDACRLVDSSELIQLVAEESGLALDAFWRRSLRHAAPPRYRIDRRRLGERDEVCFAWDDGALELPLPVRVGDELLRIEVPPGGSCLSVPSGTRVAVDTSGRLLAEPVEESGLVR